MLLQRRRRCAGVDEPTMWREGATGRYPFKEGRHSYVCLPVKQSTTFLGVLDSNVPSISDVWTYDVL
jgi:hypothetical protein